MSSEDLHKYIQENRIHLVAEFLKEHPKSVDKPDSDGRTPLMWSLSETRNPEMVSEIIKHAKSTGSFDINAADNAGFTALHIAAALGPEFVDQILALKPKVDSLTNTRQTPLMLAVSKQQDETASKLLAAGASPKVKDARQVTPLMRAAAAGAVDMVKLLLGNQAIVNATDANGWSAVHYAYSEGRTDVLDILVAHGGDLYKQTRDEELPSDLAPLGFKYKKE